MKWCLSLLTCCLLFVTDAASQNQSQERGDSPDPKVALFKSLAVPGWGHYYVDNTDWTRGKYHLAAEAAFILGYIGFTIHSNNLQDNWFAYGHAEAGVPIEGRSRTFQLAVGEFNSLEAYNDYQLRSRNWDQLFETTPENSWNWDTNEQRFRYNDLRNRFERIDRQLPALLVMMALNRVISGISAFNRAQKAKMSQRVKKTVYLSPYQFARGMVANLRIEF